MTTILSSTSRPTATATPPSVIMFSVTPDIFSKYSVTARESGIDMTVIRVALKLRKNNKITSVANRAPNNTSRIMLFTDVTTISDELKMSVIIALS
ncbi:hypothetical protein D3C78_1471770 [compost metagenome]